jgi:hypothetical protein
LEDAGKDLREIKVKRWRQKAVNREEWTSVIKKLRLPEGRTPKKYVSK